MAVTRTVRLVAVAAAALVLSGCIRFAAPEALPVAPPTTGAVLADVTGDGTADVLVGTAAGLARYEYCGSGCLNPKEVVAGERPTLVADLNDDNIDDVISGVGSSTKILFGSATGLSSANAVTIPPVAGKTIVNVGDFNGDGNGDLVLVEGIFTFYVQYVVRLGDGAGGFTASSLSVVTGPLNAGRDQVEVADVDGDGRDDLVSTSLEGIAVTRFGGQSGCVFDSTCPYFTTPNSGSLFALGDINRDGRADLARYDGSTRAIDFLRSTGNGFTAFPSYRAITVPDSGTQIEMSLRDVDGDDIVDFLLNDWTNTHTWWSGTNDGGFPVQAVNDPPRRVSDCPSCFGDVNGDELPDILLPSPFPATGVSIVLNTSF